MNRLLGMITGNPLVLLWIVLGAIAFGVATGGSAAWWIQGLRITSTKQEFTDYKQTQKGLIQEAKDKADLQREKASKDYAHLSNVLSDEINHNVVFQRCVAAGKCGVRNPIPACTGIRLPATSGTDETRANTVPAGPETAAQDPVVNDCAITTLMINQLQRDIENQPGFTKE